MLYIWKSPQSMLFQLLLDVRANTGQNSWLLYCSTQLPHAVGAAYALKMDGRDACTVTYFGDGGTSEVNI